MNKVITRIIDLPPTINGITAEDSNGDFNIYINANLTGDARKTYLHELCHITNNHFNIDVNIIECETIAESIAKNIC